MSEKIKTRENTRNIKVLDKAGNLSKRMKNAYVRTKDETQSTRQSEQNAPCEYATDKTMVSAKNTAGAVGRYSKKKVGMFIRKVKASNKPIKNTAKRTARASNKTAKNSVRTGKAAVKTTKYTVKTTVKTAQTTAKASRKAIQSARIASKAAYVATKASIKAAIVAVKCIIAGTKGLIALIAAGGWVAVVIILFICLVAMVISSVYTI